MQILIHAGFHKTGSTFIQNLLAHNRDRLPPSVAAVHQADASSQPLHAACLNYDRALRAGEDEAAAATAREAVLAACRALVNAAGTGLRTLLISDEEIAGVMPGRQGTRRIYASIGQIGAALVEGFAPHPVRFVLYQRQTERWLSSVHNQAVKQHRLRLPLDQFRDWLAEPVDLDGVLARLRAAVGGENVDVVRFEDDLQSPTGLGTALLRKAGLDDAWIAALEVDGLNLNESLHPLALELMIEFNRTRTGGAELRAIARILLARHEWFEDLAKGRIAPR
ncbi:hypothetical protein GCM10011392_36810 [Wenxinia marina]|uniref:Sulfotransferase family n=1 Tax=Wenxinia marina DSM 24838 TaxID=1123501 RepID=A0A0D0PJ39_9RHOB|nr:hypothetical protein [Wenxinia marina]KIQ71431.1 hypothetical protein Wenmar_04079 [Wenxinia marina DSM 24838]GGL78954.1 hypothetical protein GCM10011392_36810 [Wenxinia marina]